MPLTKERYHSLPLAGRDREGGDTPGALVQNLNRITRLGSPSRGPSLSRDAGEGLSATIERHLRDYFDAHESELPASGLYGRVLQEIERPLLAITLDECRGNQLRAAALLGLNRNTLRKKIRELGLAAGRAAKRKGERDD